MMRRRVKRRVRRTVLPKASYTSLRPHTLGVDVLAGTEE
jgi:hypothetical protein